jgi:carbon-monoxide dehydrogenase medium subunit
VKPAPFAYRRPETLEEAVRLLAGFAPQDGHVLAGGQSLVPIMNIRLARSAYLIDINAVAGLDGLRSHFDFFSLRARVRLKKLRRPGALLPLSSATV